MDEDDDSGIPLIVPLTQPIEKHIMTEKRKAALAKARAAKKLKTEMRKAQEKANRTRLGQLEIDIASMSAEKRDSIASLIS